MQNKIYYVYILASQRNGTLYIGVTNDLMRRVQEHKQGIFDSFTKKYKIHNLVYYESTSDVASALAREKQLKNWTRKWKLDLIEKDNPQWIDLSELDPESISGGQHKIQLDTGSSPV